MRMNVRVYNKSELYMAVREVEFSLLLLIQHIDDLFEAVLFLLQRSLPMPIAKPTTLHRILRNMSFHLPEKYELIVGTKLEDIHLYYEFIRVTIVGKLHCIKLVIVILLKTADQIFTFLNIDPLPTRISDDIFVKYS